MPVNDPNQEYEKFLPQWNRARTAYQGSDTVKGATTQYLPRYHGMDETEYQTYLNAAVWYGAPEKTVNGLTGAVLRKPIRMEVPDMMRDIMEDTTLTDTRFEKFAQDVLLEILKVGRCGVLVDMPPEGADPRPYATLYIAEDIINWRTARINGAEMLTMVVLREDYEVEEDDDPFTLDLKNQYRVLLLDVSDAGAFFYRQEIWRERTVSQTYGDNVSKKKWIKVDEIVPRQRGEVLSYLPFIFFGPDEAGPEVNKPPLLDMIDVNYQMYVNSADYERALHFCGSPVYFFSGIDREQEIHLGPNRAIVSEREGARGEILQASKESVSALREAMEDKKQDVARLGSTLLEAQRAGVESAEALRLRYAATQAALRTIATAFGEGLNEVVRTLARWAGLAEEVVSIEVNKDFVDISLTPQQIQSYMALHQGGEISYATLYALLAEGELTRAGVDWVEEREQIENDFEEDVDQLSGPLVAAPVAE
ncbi:hypothetical protein CMI37_18320 [Candidatus Pacearchaeota archaeon]|nr:hypothetical protein [Candidatus Pacearchaeota archaeon]|tara:strand:- start:43 stop:1482 length:1440 start_codon:yes stop_codon:yes gene_type:complete